jgi:hypothetical protein
MRICQSEKARVAAFALPRLARAQLDRNENASVPMRAHLQRHARSAPRCVRQRRRAPSAVQKEPVLALLKLVVVMNLQRIAKVRMFGEAPMLKRIASESKPQLQRMERALGVLRLMASASKRAFQQTVLAELPLLAAEPTTDPLLPHDSPAPPFATPAARTPRERTPRCARNPHRPPQSSPAESTHSEAPRVPTSPENGSTHSAHAN